MLKIRTTGFADYLDGSANIKMLVVGAVDTGKGFPVDTLVLTAWGWTPIGKLHVDDAIIGSDGFATTVTAVYDRGVLPVFRVLFDDGHSVLTDAEHHWQVANRHGTFDRTTAELSELSLKDEDGSKRYWIPRVAPVQYEDLERLPLHPYLLGSLLANGHFSDHVALSIGFGSEWQDLVNALRGYAPAWMRIAEVTSANSTARVFNFHQTLPILRELGLERKRSAQKFVPEIYLRASVGDRRALLAGLMDCDGSFKNGTSAYHTTSPQLRDAVIELARGLGGLATFSTDHREGQRPCYRVTVQLAECAFRHGPKARKWTPRVREIRRRIVGIEPAGNAEVRCISVAAADELYVVDGFVLTKNTRSASYWPSPFFVDCENGRGSLSDRKMPYVDVHSSADMLDTLEYLKKLERIPKAERQYKTVVIDTLDSFQRKVKDEWLLANSQGVFKGYDAWGYLDSKMQMMLTRILNLDYHVIVNCHYMRLRQEEEDATREYTLQLQGNIKDTIFNDFGLIGWMGTYWEHDAATGEKVERRGIKFKKESDKPFLKDRFNVTPGWLPITFSTTDYTQFTELFAAHAEHLPEAEEVGEIPTADPAPRAVHSITGGPVAVRAPKDKPLGQLTKPELFERAKALGLNVKGNALKDELITAIESAPPPPPATPAAPPAPTEATIHHLPSAAEPTVEQAPAGDAEQETATKLITETLGASVIAEHDTAAPATPAAVPEPERACEDCGKDLAPENQDYVQLGFIKLKKHLCNSCYAAAK